MSPYPQTRNPEAGVALAMVLVVLASIALLVTGVHVLVREGSRTAGDQMAFESARTSAEAGLGQLASLVLQSSQGAVPTGGYGLNTSNWTRDDFQAFVRGDEDARTAAATPCNAGNPDVRYNIQGTQGPMQVAACVTLAGEDVAGEGGGVGMLATDAGGGTAAQMFETTIWVTNTQTQAQSQMRASMRVP
ncbi:hypothetical protein [Thiohalorhabdus sp.]|uniref:hypothetical protein n=1 Tax=Thiohalorhabdus sp. TaxID=3094134 RepID=UPI002FC3D297